MITGQSKKCRPPQQPVDDPPWAEPDFHTEVDSLSRKKLKVVEFLVFFFYSLFFIFPYLSEMNYLHL